MHYARVLNYYDCMDDFCTISDASSIIGVSEDTIRRWEKKGLIKAQRSNLNYRIFKVDELKTLHNKLFGKSTANKYQILKNPKRSDYSSIDLFAGAGGTALGLHNAGLNHQLLVEFDKNPAETLKRNMPDWNILLEDVARVNYKGIKADVVEGGFPCQAFSYAGKKLGFEDIRGTLFFEFARCIKDVKPKVAIGENVRGLLNHDDGKTLKSMLGVLDELGYKYAYRVLRSQYLDVPQKRERLVIIAVRGDLDLPILFPKEQGYTISLKEALENVPHSPGQKYPEKKKKIMDIIPEGGYWRDLPIELQKEYMGASFYMGGGKTGMARRLSWDEPSLTLTCAPAQKQTERCHPTETRPLTVREYARIQTFPDNWEFVGTVNSQYKQIGNAVPVNLGYHIGRAVIAMLDSKLDLETMDLVNPMNKQNQIVEQEVLFNYL